MARRGDVDFGSRQPRLPPESPPIRPKSGLVKSACPPKGSVQGRESMKMLAFVWEGWHLREMSGKSSSKTLCFIGCCEKRCSNVLRFAAVCEQSVTKSVCFIAYLENGNTKTVCFTV